jgi:hypothetical protein
MTDRRTYLAAAIRLYLQMPGAPRRASRSDWAVAATLYARGLPLETLAHVVRLATLRRARPTSSLEPVHSLAYYRTVLDHLTPDALDPGYVDYVTRKYNALFGGEADGANQDAVSRSRNRAGLRRR